MTKPKSKSKTRHALPYDELENNPAHEVFQQAHRKTPLEYKNYILSKETSTAGESLIIEYCLRNGLYAHAFFLDEYGNNMPRYYERLYSEGKAEQANALYDYCLENEKDIAQYFTHSERLKKIVTTKDIEDFKRLFESVRDKNIFYNFFIDSQNDNSKDDLKLFLDYACADLNFNMKGLFDYALIKGTNKFLALVDFYDLAEHPAYIEKALRCYGSQSLPALIERNSDLEQWADAIVRNISYFDKRLFEGLTDYFGLDAIVFIKDRIKQIGNKERLTDDLESFINMMQRRAVLDKMPSDGQSFSDAYEITQIDNKTSLSAQGECLVIVQSDSTLHTVYHFGLDIMLTHSWNEGGTKKETFLSIISENLNIEDVEKLQEVHRRLSNKQKSILKVSGELDEHGILIEDAVTAADKKLRLRYVFHSNEIIIEFSGELLRAPFNRLSDKGQTHFLKMKTLAGIQSKAQLAPAAPRILSL